MANTGDPTPNTPGGGRDQGVGSVIARVIPAADRWERLIGAIASPVHLAALAILVILAVLTLLIARGTIGSDNWTVLLPAFLVTMVALVFIVSRTPVPEIGPPVVEPDDRIFDLPPDFPEEGSLDRRLDIVSSLPIIEVVTWQESEGEKTVEKTTIERMSPVAKEFFGFNMIHPTHEIIGLGAEELFGRLAAWSQPPRPFWSDLVWDQDRVKKEILAKSRAYARVPVKFNDVHEYFPGKTFVPIITEFQRMNGKEKTFLRVLYLDIDTLPKTLFTGSVWNNVIQGFDLDDLANDFVRIRQRLVEERFDDNERKDEEERQSRLAALDSAIERLRSGNDPHTFDDLSKAGWFRLRRVATSMAERPEAALAFIERVIGREPASTA